MDCQRIIEDMEKACEAGLELMEEAFDQKVIRGGYSIEDYEHIVMGAKAVKTAVKTLHMLKPAPHGVGMGVKAVG